MSIQGSASPAEDLTLVREMKAAGIEHGIAVFYGRHEIDRALFDGIKELGWVAGMYKMPTGNLFQVIRGDGAGPPICCSDALSPERFLGPKQPRRWDRVCARHLCPSGPRAGWVH